MDPHLLKMELCKFYFLGCCAKRQKCVYMHKDFPCKKYHTGVKCQSDDVCKFSHDPLDRDLKGILLQHLKMAPQDILGDFPRLSGFGAALVVQVSFSFA